MTTGLERWRETGEIGGEQEVGNCFGYARYRLFGLGTEDQDISFEQLDPEGQLEQVRRILDADAVGVTFKRERRLQHIVVVEERTNNPDNPIVSHRWMRGQPVTRELLSHAVREYHINRGGSLVYLRVRRSQ